MKKEMGRIGGGSVKEHYSEEQVKVPSGRMGRLD